MTYKEYYLSLNSPEEIKLMANADLVLARVINPDRTDIICRSAKQGVRFVGIIMRSSLRRQRNEL